MPQLLTNLEDFPTSLLRGAVSVGNFDGVHQGHARLIEQLVATARRLKGPALVMTFDPPPTALLFPNRNLSAPLTTMQRRSELLFALGVDALIAYPTDAELLSLSAEEFFQQKICDILQARAMVEGPNFRFGRNRFGDVHLLQELCVAADIGFRVVPASQDAQGMISSSRIRECVKSGNLTLANTMLTQPYSIRGVVVPGEQRGSELGFATANLEEIESLLPGPGVYAGRIELTSDATANLSGPSTSGRIYGAAVNIGPNPTFGESKAKVEVHIIGYAGGPMYAQCLEISLFEKIRDIQKFDSIDELRSQIARDVAACNKRMQDVSKLP